MGIQYNGMYMCIFHESQSHWWFRFREEKNTSVNDENVEEMEFSFSLYCIHIQLSHYLS